MASSLQYFVEMYNSESHAVMTIGLLIDWCFTAHQQTICQSWSIHPLLGEKLENRLFMMAENGQRNKIYTRTVLTIN